MVRLQTVYEAGARIAGKYRVERVLGSGGMGVVVAAVHEELQTRVALKFLSPELAQCGDVVERFLREARVCAQLRSDHVCRVSDVGRLASGEPYLVMELLEGRDLASVIAHNGPVPVATAAEFIVQACDALTEAHTAGIVHRDLKPANLFLARRRDGRALIKVLDFGIAKVREPRGDALTLTDMILGSPMYMAPEQLTSASRVDARSDLWSLGILLFELVSGRAPFIGPPVDVAYQIEHTTVPVLSDVPEGFARAVARCLEKAPERRFQRAIDVVAALRPFMPRSPDVTLRGTEDFDDVRGQATTQMRPLNLRALHALPIAPLGPGAPGQPFATISPGAQIEHGAPRGNVPACATLPLPMLAPVASTPATGAPAVIPRASSPRARSASDVPAHNPDHAHGPPSQLPTSGPRAFAPPSPQISDSGPRAAPALQRSARRELPPLVPIPDSGPRSIASSAPPASQAASDLLARGSQRSAILAYPTPQSGPRPIVASPAYPYASWPRAASPQVHAASGWQRWLPPTWRTPRRLQLVGIFATIVLCLAFGMALSLALNTCTHARGTPTTRASRPR